MQWVHQMVRLACGNVRFVPEGGTYRWYRNGLWENVEQELVEDKFYWKWQVVLTPIRQLILTRAGKNYSSFLFWILYDFPHREYVYA